MHHLDLHHLDSHRFELHHADKHRLGARRSGSRRLVGAGAGLAMLCALPAHAASPAQLTPTNLVALKGLAPVARLAHTPEGQAALAANLSVTGAIQAGRHGQPGLLPFPEQQQQALADCFVSDGNAAGLADGLGSRLGRAYLAKASYTSPKAFTSLSRNVADLIGYTNNVTKADSNAAKFFFANATSDGKAPVPAEARTILTEGGGGADTFGRAYDLPAGGADANAFGNSRPFQTEPQLLVYRGRDYFGAPSRSLDWLQGPGQDLRNNPSYPSGHTTYGFTESMLLAILVPERYRQMVVRAAEYGNSRVVLGAHYAMDVLGGRTTSLHALAHLLADDARYVGQIRRNPATEDATGRPASESVRVVNYQETLKAARADMRAFLSETCGAAIPACAEEDESRFRDERANAAFYASTQTYGLPAVHPERVGKPVDVGAVAPEAGYLLTSAFPALSLTEANAILSETLGPGGGFLDDGSAFGLYSRLDLYAAAGKAAARAAGRRAGERTER